MAPVCVIVPVSEISVMLPGTVIVGIAIDATSRNPKLPVAPVKVNVGAGNTFPCVPKLMLPAELNELPVAAVKTPLSVISPVIAVPASVPPTVDVPKFNAAASMVAVPVPVVFSETAPLKVFPALPKLMVWSAAEVVKFPAVAVIVPAPVCVIVPVSEISVMLPGTVIVGIAIDATSRNPKLPAAPVKVKVGVGSTFACVPKLMLPAELNELPVAA